MRTKTPQQADKMLDAASRLFATSRFHEVRMEDIAAEAEVGKGTLYRYFMDKDELYFALLTRASRQFLCRLEQSVAQAEGARHRLVRLCHDARRSPRGGGGGRGCDRCAGGRSRRPPRRL